MPTLFILLSVFFTPVSLTAAAFDDTARYPWRASIDFLQEQGIVEGYADGSFRPGAVLNRAELTKIVVGASFDEGAIAESADDCFPDVRAADWFAPYVCLAKEEGIVHGYPDGRFRPEAPISQPEALKIVLETFYEGVAEYPGAWFMRYFAEADYLGMGYFSRDVRPETHLLTRGEMAYFVAWMLDEDGALEDQLSYEDTLGADEVALLDEAFAWGPMDPEDCLEDEVYDEEEELCTLSEDALQEDGEEDLSGYYDEEYAPADHGEGDAEAEIVYPVSSAGLGTPVSVGNVASLSARVRDAALHRALWTRVTELVPPAFRIRLAEFRMFSDGADGMHAYVEALDDGRWALGLDAHDADADPRELTLTIIHEFGHTLTLGDDQVETIDAADYDEGVARCKPRFFTGDGCAKDESFIDRFYQAFWAGKLQRELAALAVDETGEVAAGLYERDASRFVTEYAATSVAEDIAESFAYFVFHESPTGDRERDRKVRFFEQFPSLMKLRRDMRAGIAR